MLCFTWFIIIRSKTARGLQSSWIETKFWVCSLPWKRSSKIERNEGKDWNLRFKTHGMWMIGMKKAFICPCNSVAMIKCELCGKGVWFKNKKEARGHLIFYHRCSNPNEVLKGKALKENSNGCPFCNEQISPALLPLHLRSVHKVKNGDLIKQIVRNQKNWRLKLTERIQNVRNEGRRANWNSGFMVWNQRQILRKDPVLVSFGLKER